MGRQSELCSTGKNVPTYSAARLGKNSLSARLFPKTDLKIWVALTSTQIHQSIIWNRSCHVYQPEFISGLFKVSVQGVKNQSCLRSCDLEPATSAKLKAGPALLPPPLAALGCASVHNPPLDLLPPCCFCFTSIPSSPTRSHGVGDIHALDRAALQISLVAVTRPSSVRLDAYWWPTRLLHRVGPPSSQAA